MLRTRVICFRVVRFWALAWVGNFVGALLVGAAITGTRSYGEAERALLVELTDAKMQWMHRGGAGSWFSVVLSGVLANWLVGMAAVFATMGRTIIGKYIPVLLAVSAFVAANFQHSPANMAYFALARGLDIGPGWVDALLWNVVPAGIGNPVGGAVPVTLLLAYGFSGLSDEKR